MPHAFRSKFNVCERPGFPTYNALFYTCTPAGDPGSVPAGNYKLDHLDFFPGLGGMEIRAIAVRAPGHGQI